MAFQNIDLDSARPFRRYPWFYALVGVVAIGIAALLVFGAWYVWNQKRATPVQPSGPVETPGERNNRIAIMNVLNTFHLDEGTLAVSAADREKVEAKKQHIQEVISKLEAVRIEESMKSAQNDLLAVFKKWRTSLDETPDVLALKQEFVIIAKKYPWLNTLVWLIILNRL